MSQKLSVILPVRDGARFLGEAIDSVLAERVDGCALELLVADDGSTDDSLAIAAARTGVRCLVGPPGGSSPAAARNRALAAADGDLVAFVDADDLWAPGRLAAMLAPLARDPALALVTGRVDSFGEAAHLARLAPRLQRAHRFPLFGSALVRRTVFAHVGLLDESYRFGEDVEWFQRVKESGLPSLALERVVLRRRLHADNMTRGKGHAEFETLRIVRESLARRRGAAISPERAPSR